MWLSADLFIKCTGVQVRANGIELPLPCAPENNRYSEDERAETIEVTYTYETITSPQTEIFVSYQVSGDGEILIKVHYYGKKELPELPAFGLRMIMPTCADKYVYEGLSGETYPDRKEEGVKGVGVGQGLRVKPWLVPEGFDGRRETGWIKG